MCNLGINNLLNNYLPHSDSYDISVWYAVFSDLDVARRVIYKDDTTMEIDYNSYDTNLFVGFCAIRHDLRPVLSCLLENVQAAVSIKSSWFIAYNSCSCIHQFGVSHHSNLLTPEYWLRSFRCSKKKCD